MMQYNQCRLNRNCEIRVHLLPSLTCGYMYLTIVWSFKNVCGWINLLSVFQCRLVSVFKLLCTWPWWPLTPWGRSELKGQFQVQACEHTAYKPIKVHVLLKTEQHISCLSALPHKLTSKADWYVLAKTERVIYCKGKQKRNMGRRMSNFLFVCSFYIFTPK